jgi:hypothetical protein
MRSRRPNERKVEPTQPVRRFITRMTSLPSDFDWEIYVASNADLSRANINTKEKAEAHFLRYGHAENRVYSKTSKSPARLDSHQITGWLKEELSKKKGVVFTCLAGEYDSLKEPLVKDPDWDYICFTDLNIKSSCWTILPIPTELREQIDAKKARAIKLLWHRYLPDYDYSVWVDGSILIKKPISEFVSRNFSENDIFAICKHPDRVCVYQEGAAVKKMFKDKADTVDNQLNKYRREKYPENWGMVQSGIIIRKRDDKVIQFGELWWREVEKHSRRDQLSFNYVLWRYSIHIRILNPFLFGSIYFHLYSHSKKGKPTEVKFRPDYGTLINFLNGKPV